MPWRVRHLFSPTLGGASPAHAFFHPEFPRPRAKVPLRITDGPRGASARPASRAPGSRIPSR